MKARRIVKGSDLDRNQLRIAVRYGKHMDTAHSAEARSTTLGRGFVNARATVSNAESGCLEHPCQIGTAARHELAVPAMAGDACDCFADYLITDCTAAASSFSEFEHLQNSLLLKTAWIAAANGRKMAITWHSRR